MTYATAPIAADFGIRESLSVAIRRAAAALEATVERANHRKCYRAMLRNDELLRDIGITREELQAALTAR